MRITFKDEADYKIWVNGDNWLKVKVTTDCPKCEKPFTRETFAGAIIGGTVLELCDDCGGNSEMCSIELTMRYLNE